MAKKRNKIELFKLFTQYGIHIWAILIIANAALVYAFHYSTQAAENRTSVQSQAQSEGENSVALEEGQAPQPKGPVIALNFTVPGIGSGGATMTPKRLKRNLTVYLYATDVNSLNPTVKPLYTIKSSASFVTDKNSPFYTTFGNQFIDLGEDVKEGNYQVLFRTDESLRTLIKDNPDDIGGKVVNLSPATIAEPFPIQTVLMGDTIPKEGNNTIDISDYNAFVNCFGENNTSEFCAGNNYGDFDDNGVIDGLDYNILLLSFQSLLKQGQTIPKISIAPTGPGRVSKLSDLVTPTPKKSAPKVSPTEAPEATTDGAGNILGGILFFIFLIILGVGGFFFLKKNEPMRSKLLSLLHMSPTGTPPAKPEDPAGAAETPATPSEPTAPDATTPPASDATTPETPPAADGTDASAAPADIAASTEVPVESLPQETQAEPAPETPPAETPTAAPTETPPAETPPGTVEKDCYVKKVGPDEAGIGFWIRLTDDNGATEAHYTAASVEDGFAKVKGVMKTEGDKTFLEVSELTPSG